MVFAVTIWHLWEARNSIRNGENMLHPHRISEKVKAYAEMIMLHSFKLNCSTRCESNPSFKWVPPPENWVMVNVDAAVFAASKRMGVGVVIRDHRGQFLAACSQYVDKITDPELAETIATRVAVCFAKDLGYPRVIIASDCLALIRKLTMVEDRSHTKVVINDIKRSCGPPSKFSFIHVKRQCNEAAHVLAKSSELCTRSVWLEEAPEIIRPILSVDRMG